MARNAAISRAATRKSNADSSRTSVWLIRPFPPWRHRPRTASRCCIIGFPGFPEENGACGFARRGRTGAAVGSRFADGLAGFSPAGFDPFRPKIAKIPFLKSPSFQERRVSHADQTRDLRKRRGRPRIVDGARAGQPFESPTGARAATDRVIVVQRNAADAGWNVATAAVSGNGFAAASPAQIRRAKFRAADALRTIVSSGLTARDARRCRAPHHEWSENLILSSIAKRCVSKDDAAAPEQRAPGQL